ncbi:c-type cytochrome [Paenibacillus spongiae]|uniref:Cytochrome c n=1 Tax=Paenibacillus spongiae TaxID=2909671 RepID=A0ABY5S4L3_9BACL|nr:cytochrome c [Paenibacillus spongiae]UVI28839.1 cytochrome c [Paenibacillus spongiae]
MMKMTSNTPSRILRNALPLMLGAVMILLTGCGGGGSNTLEGPAQTVKIYKANCVSCHGSELQGKMGASSNLQDVGARMTEEEIIQQIRDGEGSMPEFASKLEADEITALAEWLASKK